MAFWPNKGDADPRPELGAAYDRLEPVAPRSPVVPEEAPGSAAAAHRRRLLSPCGKVFRNPRNHSPGASLHHTGPGRHMLPP